MIERAISGRPAEHRGSRRRPHSSAPTSRWVTARSIRGPSAETQTPCAAAAAATSGRRHVAGVDHHDVGLHGGRVTAVGRLLGDGRGEAPRRPRGRRPAGRGGGRARTPRRRPGSRPAACRRPAACARPGPGRCRAAGADQHRADRRAEPLGEADADGVEQPAVVGQRDPGGHVGVPQPGAVEVVAEPAARHSSPSSDQWSRAGSCRRRSCGCSPPPPPRSRPGRARRPGRRPRPPRRRPPARTDGKVRMVSPCTAAWAPISARAMWALTSQTTSCAGLDQQPDAEQVGQRPAGAEQPGLVPEQVRDPLLQRADGRVLAVDVVAHRGGEHRGPHPGGGLGDGVGAQVDHERASRAGGFAPAPWPAVQLAVASARAPYPSASQKERAVRLHRVGPLDPPGGQPLGDQEGQLQRLVAVEPRVAQRLVAVDQVGLDQVVAAADALGDVVAGQLHVHAARPGAELLVHVEEPVQLLITSANARVL